MAGGGNLVWVEVLRVTGMVPDTGTKMELRSKFKKFMETVDQSALISLAILGVVLFFLIITILMASSDVTKLGPVGDFFGGILNPILSFFAFIAVVITFRAQTASNLKSEQASNEVLKGQEQQLKQLVAQGALAERQAFESVLFGLIQHYSNNVSTVKLDFDNSSERGRDAFNELAVKFTVDGINLIDHAAAMPWQRIDEVYKKFSIFTEYDIGHCFRSAIQVVKYIDTTDCFLHEEKRRYFDMFLSLVSMSELKGLLFYTLSQKNLSEFDLLQEYGFLNWQTFNDRNALEVANYLSNRRGQIRHCQMMFNDQP
ncbi:putative phage abortive infection protein [Pseudomonas capeferrum]